MPAAPAPEDTALEKIVIKLEQTGITSLNPIEQAALVEEVVSQVPNRPAFDPTTNAEHKHLHEQLQHENAQQAQHAAEADDLRKERTAEQDRKRIAFHAGPPAAPISTAYQIMLTFATAGFALPTAVVMAMTLTRDPTMALVLAGVGDLSVAAAFVGYALMPGRVNARGTVSGLHPIELIAPVLIASGLFLVRVMAGAGIVSSAGYALGDLALLLLTLKIKVGISQSSADQARQRIEEARYDERIAAFTERLSEIDRDDAASKGEKDRIVRTIGTIQDLAATLQDRRDRARTKANSAITQVLLTNRAIEQQRAADVVREATLEPNVKFLQQIRKDHEIPDPSNTPKEVQHGNPFWQQLWSWLFRRLGWRQ